MKAVVLEKTCTAEELTVRQVPLPSVKAGWVLVKVKGFGLNRSELMLRSYEASASYIQLPRIPGIECVGEIADSSDSHFSKGQRVVALMGGMGRSFDGSYAEYALLPVKQVFAVNSDMCWQHLAAIPETYFTAYSSLFECLQLQVTDTLLIRGATSVTGLAALQLAKSIRCTVLASTRKQEKRALLKCHGADHVLVDDGNLPEQLREIYPQVVNKVLELVGPATMEESIGLLVHHGIICATGVLGSKESFAQFDPIKSIPNGVYLTSFFSNYPTQKIMDDIFNHIQIHQLQPLISQVFSLDDMVAAHLLMESNEANGKIVVMTE
ncbi:MAG: alcohol dehydrogenase [Firmicutes bacterium]|nr:alcohol dehydrogenase [Bacillota bacterium]